MQALSNGKKKRKRKRKRRPVPNRSHHAAVAPLFLDRLTACLGYMAGSLLAWRGVNPYALTGAGAGTRANQSWDDGTVPYGVPVLPPKLANSAMAYSTCYYIRSIFNLMYLQVQRWVQAPCRCPRLRPCPAGAWSQRAKVPSYPVAGGE